MREQGIRIATSLVSLLVLASAVAGGQISGGLRVWHKVTITFEGPQTGERAEPNPFVNYRLDVTFSQGEKTFLVPGYYAADGDAANSGADAGNKWRVHFAPCEPGPWSYRVSFRKGRGIVVSDDPDAGAGAGYMDGETGSFVVAPTDKQGRDLRGRGRLQYVGAHYLQFAGTGEYFLKVGADAPETFLAYADFDGTEARKANVPLKTWQPHVRDWREGDPTWKDGKGKGMIGALNYLAGKGCNAFSFLPYNAGGDGDNVWPFLERNAKLRYDCSKLDQWGIVFDHATRMGLYLHFKLQENEIDDDRLGNKQEEGLRARALDGGKLGPQRKLYCRELIARFAHNLALNWNIGEENTQSTEEVVDMVRYLHDTDPYKNHIVIHTFPDWQDKVYTPLLGEQSLLTGTSLQNNWNQTHQRTLQWVVESAKAGRPWVVANDEQGSANLGVPPDPGYQGFSGTAGQGNEARDLHDIRKATLWGNLMAGGAGVEYYFGYQLPANDLTCEDYRSRDQSWDYCRIALEFFHACKVPFWEMTSADALIGNSKNDNSKYCLAKPGQVYVVYLPGGGTTNIDLGTAAGTCSVAWYNPRTGGALREGSITTISAPGVPSLGQPPSDPQEDWVVLIRQREVR
jgi:hypothetical protein